MKQRGFILTLSKYMKISTSLICCDLSNLSEQLDVMGNYYDRTA